MTPKVLGLLGALLVALSCVACRAGNSTPPNAMAASKTLFFLSGPQQRLESAIRANDAAAISQLLSSGAPLNARGKHDVTPLMIAVDAQAPQATAALLAAGADIRPRAADGASAVHLAVENHAVLPNGHAILEMIMKAGGDPNTLRPDEDPVIMRFVYDHDLDDLRWFKSLGADMNIRARTSRPLIADVAFAQDWDSVWCLIELGANYDYEHTVYPLSEALDSSYASAPDSPLYSYKLKVWQLLKDKGVNLKPLRQTTPTPSPTPTRP